MISQQTADGTLSMLWDDNTLDITYLMHNGDYYEKKYEKSEIVKLHPLIKIDPTILKDCIDENKAIVEIKGSKAIVSYSVVHARRTYTFDLITDLQKDRVLANNIHALETKVNSIGEKIHEWIQSTRDSKEKVEKMNRKIRTLEKSINNDDAIDDLKELFNEKLYELKESMDELVDEKIDELKTSILSDFISEYTINGKLQHIETVLSEKKEELKSIESRINSLTQSQNNWRFIFEREIEELRHRNWMNLFCVMCVFVYIILRM